MSVGMHMASREGIAHIVRNLRARDRAEIFALRWNDDEDTLIDQVSANAGALWRVWSWDGEPVAINGVVPVRPGVVVAGAFGTDKWRFTLRAMTRWSLEFVIPALRCSNYHRGEAYVLASNTDSRRWIESLGAEIESVLLRYGRNREDFLLYVWDLTKDKDQDHVLQLRRQYKRDPVHLPNRH